MSFSSSPTVQTILVVSWESRDLSVPFLHSRGSSTCLPPLSLHLCSKWKTLLFASSSEKPDLAGPLLEVITEVMKSSEKRHPQEGIVLSFILCFSLHLLCVYRCYASICVCMRLCTCFCVCVQACVYTSVCAHVKAPN